MPAISVGKLVPGQRYSVDGQVLTFQGTRFNLSNKMDTNPVKFGYATYGDRWVFLNEDGEEVVYKKGYSANGNPGLVPANGEVSVEKVARIVA